MKLGLVPDLSLETLWNPLIAFVQICVSTHLVVNVLWAALRRGMELALDVL